MLAPAMIALATVGQTWYGPTTVSFSLPAEGNPYDPVINDVWVEFRGPGGHVERRLAYFDGTRWNSTLLAHAKGTYRAVVFRNGKSGATLPPVSIAKPLPGGFVRLGGPKGFRFDDGTPYWPLGHDLAWSSNVVPDLPAYLRKMGAEGLNWSRIWANHWDDKNPFWPTRFPKPRPGEMSPQVLRKWDAIVAAAQTSGIRFQLTLFHHGPWSTRVNSNWPENPWNVKNGGWLKTPSEFFTDPKAQALSRAWLRYAVARWGHSPAIMAWELFNEVEWCDPNYEKQEAVVGRWHDAMADYIRSLDPYHHLVTTSSHLELPIYRKMDYYQPHTYPPSVEAAVAAAPKLGKPLFFGEFGPGDFSGNREVQAAAIRDGIYTALLVGHAGSGQYWSWDFIPPNHLESEFVRAAKLVKLSGADRLPGFKPRLVVLNAGTGGDLVAIPGMGWGTSTQFGYRLPEEADVLGRLSTFLQGKAHPEMQPKPVEFRFTLPKPSKITVAVSNAAPSGGRLTIEVDGRPVASVPFAPTTFSSKGATIVTDEISAGPHVLTLHNDGPDWIQIGKVVVPGIAPRATARAASNGSRAALRIKGEKGLSVTLEGLGLKDGKYSATLADLDGGDTTVPLVVRGGKPNRKITLPGKDTFVVIK